MHSRYTDYETVNCQFRHFRFYEGAKSVRFSKANSNCNYNGVLEDLVVATYTVGGNYLEPGEKEREKKTLLVSLKELKMGFMEAGYRFHKSADTIAQYDNCNFGGIRA